MVIILITIHAIHHLTLHALMTQEQVDLIAKSVINHCVPSQQKEYFDAVRILRQGEKQHFDTVRALQREEIQLFDVAVNSCEKEKSISTLSEHSDKKNLNN